MNQEFKVIISLIPVFYDKNYIQSNPEHVKILLDDNKVIRNNLTIFHKDITNCLEDLFSDYIKINYEWPSKELISCRKDGDTLEIIYVTSMPMINGSLKKGKLYNIVDFINIVEDKYYVESINGITRRF